MKRRTTLGFIETPNGRHAVRDRTVARMLEEQQENFTRARDGWQREATEHTATKLRLAKLQNHWLVRLGEALKLVKP